MKMLRIDADEISEMSGEQMDAYAVSGTSPPAKIQSPHLTVIEAADYVRLAPQTLYNLRSSGVLGGKNSGRKGARVTFTKMELDAFLAGQPSLSVKKGASK